MHESTRPDTGAKTEVFYVRVTPEMHAAASARALADDRTLPDYIRRLVRLDTERGR